MTWLLLALSMLVASASTAQPSLPACQRQDRRAALPTTPTEPVPEVYVAAGNLTTVAFNGPLDRDSLVVDRTRFKWVDVGDRLLTLEPFTDLGPGERLILQVGFKDRALPTKAVLAVVSKAEMMDGKVEVDRRANTPEALLAALTQKEAEMGAASRSASSWESLDSSSKIRAPNLGRPSYLASGAPCLCATGREFLRTPCSRDWLRYGRDNPSAVRRNRPGIPSGACPNLASV